MTPKQTEFTVDSDDRQTPVAATTAALTASAGKLLKRTEAARLLGISVSTLRRREGELLEPIIGEGGVRYFEESEVRAIMIHGPHSVTDRNGVNGEIAAEVFELLDQELHPADIVKRLKLLPSTVVSLRDQWAHMRGGFFVAESDVTALRREIGGAPLASGAQLVARLRNDSSRLLGLPRSTTCRYCARRAGCVCETCLVERRGPAVAMSTRLEQRTTEAGTREARVVAELMWDDKPFEPGGRSCVSVYSEWQRPDRADVAEFIEALTTPRS